MRTTRPPADPRCRSPASSGGTAGQSPRLARSNESRTGRPPCDILPLAKILNFRIYRSMNITAVAERARVSTARVRRVTNGTVNVSPETAERVREAIQTLDFYPDISARTLGSGRSGLYGLIISGITNPYFRELVKAFEDIAVEHGQDVLIANTDSAPNGMDPFALHMFLRK